MALTHPQQHAYNRSNAKSISKITKHLKWVEWIFAEVEGEKCKKIGKTIDGNVDRSKKL